MIVAIALAFALGSVGTATASGLTKGTVKKIAAKVVKKTAPTLSVAHATTADNATNATTAATLQGSTADALKNHAFTYVLPVQAVAAQHRYTFPGLPVGKYLVQYSYNAQVQGGAIMACQIELANSTTPYAAVSYGFPGLAGFNRASSSAVITTTPTTDLFCITVSGGTWNMVDSVVVEDNVSFIPIDVTTRTNATATKSGPGSVAPGASGVR